MNLEISASQLSLGTVGDDVACVHQAMQALGRSVPVSETASRHGCCPERASDRTQGKFPASTMPGSAKEIRDKPAKFDSDPRVVCGSVCDANRRGEQLK